MSTGRDKRESARNKLEARMAEKAASARRKRRIQISLASVLALALVGGLGFVVFKLASNSSSPAAEEEKDDRVEAGDGHPKDDVVIEGLTISDPASADDGSDKCEYTEAGEDEVSQNEHLEDVGTPGNGDKPNTGTQDMQIELSQGPLTVEVDNEKAPCTAASFTHLAAADFFADSECHRVTTEGLFVLQCGDPSGTGQGGPTYTFDNEYEPEDTAEGMTEEDAAAGETPEPNYKAGTLAMANSGPDTNGSQFFLVYDDSYLPPDYTILGEITEGLDVVEGIAEKGAWLTPEEQMEQQQQQQQQQQVPMG